MHAHDHRHDHSHSPGGLSSYFTEQLCTIGVSAAYASAMGVMVYAAATARFSASADGERTVLSTLTGWIQVMVCVGAMILFALVILRAVAVWRQSRSGQGHTHDHGHDHAHDHDHDHGWSPSRYIPLLVPLVMFFLGLPNTWMIQAFENDLAMGAGGGNQQVPMGADPGDVAGSLGIAALGEFGMNGAGGWQYALGCAISYAEEETSLPIESITRTGLDELERAALNPASREHWKSRPRIQIEGMFNRVASGEQGQALFRVVRLRVACCITDARPASVMAMCRKGLSDVDRVTDKKTGREVIGTPWVAVQGKVDFGIVEGKWTPFVRAFQVKKAPQPADHYLR